MARYGAVPPPPTRYVCECCWLNDVAITVTDTARICKPCRGHLNSAPNMRADHRRIVEAHVENARRQLDAARVDHESQSTKIATLRAELKVYEDGIAASEVDAELSEHARERIDRTKAVSMQQRARDVYYQRDMAMNALSVIVYSKDSKALDPVIDIYRKWEAKQIGYMNEGKDHGLSRDHPKAVEKRDQRWRGRAAIRL